MIARRGRGLTASEFRQRVRQYPRDELLLGIGQTASRLAQARQSARPDDQLSSIWEGCLLLLAGVGVTRCNNHRNETVTPWAVEGPVRELLNVSDRGLDGPNPDGALQRSLSRTMYLQMPFQNEPWPPMMRTLCLFGDDLRFGEPAIDRAAWHDIVGVSVGQFLQIGFLMYAAAIRNDGTIDRTVFDPGRFDPIVAPLTIGEALEIADEWLTKPVGDLAALGRARLVDEDDLWGYNPFFEHPIALLDGGAYVMPSPLGVLQRLSPQGVFFIIVDAINSGRLSTTVRDFSDALGVRFERYIGVQLEQLKHIELHREIAYDKGQKKSVDYIIETPEALVLVEVKSRPPDAAARAGVDLDHGKMQELFRKACDQIDRTVEQITQGNPKFPPHHGRALRGLIITREQYYNLPVLLIGGMMPIASVPTTVWSSQVLEHATASLIEDQDCGKRLLEALAPDTDRLYTTTDPLTLGHNPLLKGLWDQWELDWPKQDGSA